MSAGKGVFPPKGSEPKSGFDEDWEFLSGQELCKKHLCSIFYNMFMIVYNCVSLYRYYYFLKNNLSREFITQYRPQETVTSLMCRTKLHDSHQAEILFSRINIYTYIYIHTHIFSCFLTTLGCKRAERTPMNC